MDITENIKKYREENQWSQAEMAEKMNMTLNGYAKIERGETNLNLYRLEQIANIFNMDLLELMNTNGRGIFFLMNENGDNKNYCGDNEKDYLAEIEKLKLSLSHKDDIIQKQNDEIIALKEIITLLKNK